MSEKDRWLQLVMDGPDALLGRKIIEIVDLLQTIVPTDLAILHGMQWTGQELGEIGNNSGQVVILQPHELVANIGINVRFSWGTIYFTTQERQAAASITQNETMQESIGKSLYTLRVVDGHLLFLYTQSEAQCDAVTSAFEVEEVKQAPLSDLDHAY